MQYFEKTIAQLKSHFPKDKTSPGSTPFLVLLEGDLGAGKTTFVKEFLQNEGFSASGVQSPTFLKVIEYQVDSLGLCLHMDTYRMEDDDDFERLGLENYLEATIWFVEWPDKLLDYLRANPQLARLIGFKKCLKLVFSAHGEEVQFFDVSI